MPSSVTVLGSNHTQITLTFDSSSNYALGQQLANVINASVPGGHYLTTFDNVPAPPIPSGFAGGFYQTTSGSGGMPPGYTVDLVNGPPNAIVAGSGLPNEIIMSDENTNLRFIAAAAGSGTVVGGGGVSILSVPGANGGNWELFSGAGNDAIYALGTGSDTLDAGGGRNLLQLGGGSDSIVSEGDDTVVGGTGAETVTALNASTTYVRGNASSLYFVGGSGGATILGGSGSDTYLGGVTSGNQFVRGGTGGNNFLFAGGGAATLLGGGAGDQLFAFGNSNQFLTAGAGAETLSASASFGNVSLTGGSGKDLMIGGAGSDTFAAGTGNSTVQVGFSDVNTFSFVSGSAGGEELVQDIIDPTSIKISLQNYGAGEEAFALGSQAIKNGSLTMQLSDGTRITFEDVNQKLTGSNFT
jgi:Ca2+-binding RTX toxin-like protein